MIKKRLTIKLQICRALKLKADFRWKSRFRSIIDRVLRAKGSLPSEHEVMGSISYSIAYWGFLWQSIFILTRSRRDCWQYMNEHAFLYNKFEIYCWAFVAKLTWSFICVFPLQHFIQSFDFYLLLLYTYFLQILPGGHIYFYYPHPPPKKKNEKYWLS